MSPEPRTVSLPGAIVALLLDAGEQRLLHDAETLAGALADAGWSPEVESGRFSADGWDIVSSASPPSLSVFCDADLLDVRGAALALAALLRADSREWAFATEGPDWSAWPLEDPRWDAEQIDWLEWRRSGVVIQLFTAPAVAAGPGTLPPHLHLAIEREDAPSGGVPRDDAHDRRTASEGSVVERWYLVGEHELSDDVLALLESDPDQRVGAAAASERRMRDHGFGARLEP